VGNKKQTITAKNHLEAHEFVRRLPLASLKLAYGSQISDRDMVNMCEHYESFSMHVSSVWILHAMLCVMRLSLSLYIYIYGQLGMSRHPKSGSKI